MKTLILIFVLSFAAAAQNSSNVTGLTLSGSASHPMIENHSGKSVLWLSWKRLVAPDITGHREGGQWFIDQAGGLPDGSSAELGRYNSKTMAVTAATIIAAIFGDGEFRGGNIGPIHGDVERDFQLIKATWHLAQAGEWDKVQAQADKTEDGVVPAIAAKKLLQARGNDAAMAALAFFGTLPASTWTGGH